MALPIGKHIVLMQVCLLLKEVLLAFKHAVISIEHGSRVLASEVTSLRLQIARRKGVIFASLYLLQFFQAFLTKVVLILLCDSALFLF
jgi:hypothetical protein